MLLAGAAVTMAPVTTLTHRSRLLTLVCQVTLVDAIKRLQMPPTNAQALHVYLRRIEVQNDMLRNVMVVVAGCVCGVAWAVGFVDFPPHWLEESTVLVGLGLFALPLAGNFILGFLLDWWRAPHAFAFSCVVLSWWIPSCIIDELNNTGNVSHLGGVEAQVVQYAVAFAVLMACWGSGRFLRNRFHQRGQPRDSSGDEL